MSNEYEQFFQLINKFWKNSAMILWICSIILQWTSKVLNIFYELFFWVSDHSPCQLITNMFTFSIHELVLIHCMFLKFLLFSSANLISFTYLLTVIFYDLSISGICLSIPLLCLILPSLLIAGYVRLCQLFIVKRATLSTVSRVFLVYILLILWIFIIFSLNTN